MGFLLKQPAGQSCEGILVETPSHLYASGQALAPWTALGASGRAGFGRVQFREERSSTTVFLSHPVPQWVRRHKGGFVGKVWRNICKKLWHLCTYTVQPGEEGTSSASKMG